MKEKKIAVHFTDNELMNPVHPVTVNLIGAGATGSKVLTGLAEMHHSLRAFNHPGLHVRVWDDDIITQANLGRQRFADSQVGLLKSVALINNANRWAGTNWKAETKRFQRNTKGELPKNAMATIFFSCVDNVDARFEIADILRNTKGSGGNNKPKYWIDCGNGKRSGQVILSTVGQLIQPASELYEPVGKLLTVTEEFGDLLRQSEEQGDTPSCSLPEALQKQDLYINASIAPLACELLWRLFRYGMTEHRGFFLNLKDFKSNPIPVG